MAELMDGGVSVSVDVALILTALAPTMAILTTAWLQSRDRKRDSGKLDGIHTLVNDQMTREKAARLGDLRAQKAVLERLLGDQYTEAEMEMLVGMEQRIEVLAREVEKRDEAAERVATGGDP